MLQARNGFKQLLLPATGNARDTEYLPAERREAHVVEHLHAVGVRNAEVAHGQPLYRVLRLGAVNIQCDLFAYHHFRERKLGRVLCFDRADIPSLAEDGHSVRSDRLSTSWSLWVMMMTDFPSFLMLRITAKSFSVS